MAEVRLAEPLAIPNSGQQESQDWNCIESSVFQVFSNHLLFEKISNCLCYSDLKSLRETGKLLLESTRICRRFIQKTQLNIVPGNNATEVMDVPTPEFIRWDSVKLDMRVWNVINWNMERVLSTTTNLALELKQKLEDAFLKPSDTENPPYNIVQLLLSAPNLRTFKLSAKLLTRVENLFDFPALRLHLCSLATLNISVTNEYVLDQFMKNVYDQVGESYQIFTRNICSLATLPTSLSSFTFQMKIPARLELPEGTRIPHLEAVVSILVQNRKTLKELSLHGRVWSYKELAEVHCPLLRSLDANVKTSYSTTNVGTFIERQPFLRTLVLRIEGKVLGTSDIANVIRRKSVNLERLDISWTMNDDYEPGILFDWKFLKKLTELKQLTISQIERRRIIPIRVPFPTILANLPSSLRKLQIYCPSAPMNDLDLIISLNKLTNLTVLDVLYPISDSGLQFVCSEMTQLLVLRLNDCYTLTDRGISWKRANGVDTDASIAKLKRLRELNMRRCHHVLFTTLVSVVVFPELKQLNLDVCINWNDVQDTSEQIVKMATQNPRLEELGIGNCRLEEEKAHQLSKEGIKAAIQKRLPRFKNLRLYSKSGYPEEPNESVYEEELP